MRTEQGQAVATRIILVGGFLGAGKTTLLLRAARSLAARGHRVGIVTNDQGNDLIDTALAVHQEIPVTEVAGGCFCCRFPDLLGALARLQESVAPDVILAEPVGSCTDLIATVVRPLYQFYRERFTVAPFTVLVDPERGADSLPATVRYLHRKQMAEAEIVVLNKIDRLAPAASARQLAELGAAHAGATILALSARTGAGVDDWLQTVMTTTSNAARPLDIDYVRYAEAEAALGWLNARGTLRAERPFAAGQWMQTLLHGLDDAFAQEEALIAHIKVHLVTPTATLKTSLTGAGSPLSWDTDEIEAETTRAQFLLNVRVHAAPRILARTVRQILDNIKPAPGFRHDLTHFECFSPLPPQPTYRL